MSLTSSAEPVTAPMSGRIDAPDAELHYHARAFPGSDADRLFEMLLEGVDWRQHHVTIAGRTHPCPRLSAWYGDPDAAYAYSGLSLEPTPWNAVAGLGEVKNTVEAICRCRFNSVLANLYRNGRDGMGWHADDEPELGPTPTIASVSLGAARRFRMRHRRHRDLAPLSLRLEPGSLLVMSGPTQRSWHHSLPKSRRFHAPRINLTFRRIRR